MTRQTPAAANAEVGGGDPSQLAQEMLNQLDATLAPRFYYYTFKDISNLAETQRILKAGTTTQIAFIRRVIQQSQSAAQQAGRNKANASELELHSPLSYHRAFPKAGILVAAKLLSKKLPIEYAELITWINQVADAFAIRVVSAPHLKPLLDAVAAHETLSDELDEALRRLDDAVSAFPASENERFRTLIQKLLRQDAHLPLFPGEAWSDRALQDINAMPSEQRQLWCELLTHCQSATAGKPAAKWLKTAGTILDRVGQDGFREMIVIWLPLVDQPRTQTLEHRVQFGPDPNMKIIGPHEDILKGLAWSCSHFSDPDIARAVSALALSSYRKLPMIGPRMVKVGNACIFALGNMPGLDAVGQLAYLKVKVKFGTAQKEIAKALTAAANREGMPNDELEEIAVPAYGLTEVGRLLQPLGEYTAELVVTGTSSTELNWLASSGKRQKSIPAAVKRDFADDLKDLKTAAKDIQKMLPAQRDRIDSLYLESREWPVDVWRERYLDHPLVGNLARRLIWKVDGDGASTPCVYREGQLLTADGQLVTRLDESSKVQLWHPLDSDRDAILAWRTWFEERQVEQPFKQAHREIYLLTDAEQNTRVYSNRFAAHVIKQHQFNALCGVRGWKNQLRLMVDASYPPAYKLLPKYGLRAEFWIEPLGDNYGHDTNESGVYHYLTTDQVRFYALAAAQRQVHAGGGGYHRNYGVMEDDPLPLEQVPPLVFSEIMRDVDLFVGVCSVANDPTWADGGTDDRNAPYWNYWQSRAFGELGETANTRRDVLERLIPRLKIADRCELTARFVVVRGTFHKYKIHLGSGNILMSPDDAYLCIVPKSEVVASQSFFLPFEGDRILSIILSKAFLLADDANIKDPSIISQIRR